jgi:hypothetical protein
VIGAPLAARIRSRSRENQLSIVGKAVFRVA